LGLWGCAAPQPGPVEPMTGPKAGGVLVIDPALQAYLDVPAAQQNYSYNKSGFLEYNALLRNKGQQAMTLSSKASFYDETGSKLISEGTPDRFFIDPQSEKPLQVIAPTKEAKVIRVQIR